jgi:hypothetical protein
MGINSQRRSVEKNIKTLERQLLEIAELKDTINTPGWVKVRQIFKEVIGTYTQDVYNMTDDPQGNDYKIRVKRFVAEALGRIFTQVDSNANSAELKQQQLDNANEALSKTINTEDEIL